jgi:hypothetical protein
MTIITTKHRTAATSAAGMMMAVLLQPVKKCYQFTHHAFVEDAILLQSAAAGARTACAVYSDDGMQSTRPQTRESSDYASPFTAVLLLKLVMVLLSSIAMVIGPTPPGTGVMAPAVANASAHTSPTVLLPATTRVTRHTSRVTRHTSHATLPSHLFSLTGQGRC